MRPEGALVEKICLAERSYANRCVDSARAVHLLLDVKPTLRGIKNSSVVLEPGGEDGRSGLPIKERTERAEKVLIVVHVSEM